MPDCRANNLPGWTQGGMYNQLSITAGLSTILSGSSPDNIVSHFAVSYHNEAARLGINLDDLYSALLADGELNPPEWSTTGRQVNVYKYVLCCVR